MAEGYSDFEQSAVTARRERLQTMIGQSSFDAFLATTPANVTYASGYLSAAASIYTAYQMAAVATATRSILIAPGGDVAAALDAGVACDDIVSHGEFYFEGLAKVSGHHPDFAGAVCEALAMLGLDGHTVAVDLARLDPDTAREVASRYPRLRVVSGSRWACQLRGAKLPAEIARLKRAAQLAEAGIERAFSVARQGSSEADVAIAAASAMAEGGGIPRLLSVSMGPRSALGDVFASPENRWKPGDILRVDIGCVVDGYWSDIARCAVLGEPSPEQRAVYTALLEGQRGELDAVRCGVSASSLFEAAVHATRTAGLPGYRRHHTGHGIGLDVYDAPLIGPKDDTELPAGAVICCETPFYRSDWGGLMVEDTVVVTEAGYEPLTHLGKELHCVSS